ncbi:MAG: hypothetical protein H0U79_07020 [Solirubrobacterales bacterium]|nr:hypothetical protein [Solirubrobacterales bacterium]
MNHPNDHTHHIRRVVLPSGKAIDVVYFEALPEAAPAAQRLRSTPDMHVCGACESQLVYPTDWDEAGTSHWEVTLRCPECEWAGTGVFGQEAVERFDEELDRGTETLVGDLKRLVQGNMEEDIDRFVAALEADHIVPEDF